MSIKNKQALSDMIFDIKEKITDTEYKNIMDKIGEIKKYVKIKYVRYDAYVEGPHNEDDEYVPKIRMTKGSLILKVTDKLRNCGNIYCAFFLMNIISENMLSDWKEENEAFPEHIRIDDETILMVTEFEEL